MKAKLGKEKSACQIVSYLSRKLVTNEKTILDFNGAHEFVLTVAIHKILWLGDADTPCK